MGVIEDYAWLPLENERGPGMQDYIQCALKIQEKLELASKLTVNAAKKGIVITIDNSELVETNLMMPYIDASVLGLDPEELRGRFSIAVDFFTAVFLITKARGQGIIGGISRLGGLLGLGLGVLGRVRRGCGFSGVSRALFDVTRAALRGVLIVGRGTGFITTSEEARCGHTTSNDQSAK